MPVNAAPAPLTPLLSSSKGAAQPRMPGQARRLRIQPDSNVNRCALPCMQCTDADAVNCCARCGN